MRDKLKTYIDFLFAGAPKTAATEETKAEILQNTLDKYDDLVSQGKSPEAAYSLSVSGIGDPRAFLSGEAPTEPTASFAGPSASKWPDWLPSLLLAGAVMLYILCVVPVILLDDAGVVFMFLIIAVATSLLIFRGYFLGSTRQRRDAQPEDEEVLETDSPMGKLRKTINRLISILALVFYLILSFTTMAWHITWVIFPISAALQGIVTACFELAE